MRGFFIVKHAYSPLPETPLSTLNIICGGLIHANFTLYESPLYHIVRVRVIVSFFSLKFLHSLLKILIRK